MRINNNIMALNTHRQLSFNQTQGAKSLEKLSSGYRINRAGDDAAGLAISEKMRSQIRGLSQAQRNAQDGISMIQTAEGALSETHSILQRMRELAVQSATDTNTDADREELQKEVDELRTELDRIASATEFNTSKLLNGDGAVKLNKDTAVSDLLADGAFEKMSFSGLSAETWTLAAQADNSYTLTGGTSGTVLISGIPVAGTAGVISFGGPNGESVSIYVNNSIADDALDGLEFEVTGSGGFEIHIGANASQAVSLTIDDMRITAGGTAEIAALAGVDITDQTGANAAIGIIDDAIETVSATRSTLGAYQNRLEHTINNLGASAENLQAAESRIRDVDMAAEMMEFTKNNILQQAATAMLAQANMLPQSVLQLLG